MSSGSRLRMREKRWESWEFRNSSRKPRIGKGMSGASEYMTKHTVPPFVLKNHAKEAE